jgi:hypothetical protein
MAKKNSTSAVTVTLNTVPEMEQHVLDKLGLTSIPSNKDTGASGKYNAWTKEQRDYNDAIVRPFRERVARLIKTAMEDAIKAGDATAVFVLMVTGLSYVDKQSKMFYNPAPDTTVPNAPITDNVLLAELIKRGISEDVARAMLTK